MVPWEAHTRAVVSVAFSPGSDRLATAGRDRRVRVWSAEGTVRHAEYSNPTFRQVAFTPDGGGIIADGAEDITVWNADGTGQRLVIAPAGSGWVFTFSPGGQLAVYSSVEFLCNSLEWFSPVDGTRTAAWEVLGPSGGFVLRFSPDERRLALPSDLMMAEFDTTSRKLLWQGDLPTGPTPLLSYSPDGRHLAYGAGRQLVVTEAGKPTPIAQMRNPRHHFTGIAFHPSGRYLAATSNDATVKLYDTATWAVARTFAWDIGRLRSVAFSPDGTRAAVGSDTGKVLVWDVDV